MQAQVKATESNCSIVCGVGAGFRRLQGAKTRLEEGQELNALVANAVKII